MNEHFAENDALLNDLRNDLIDGMAVPPGGPDDEFWRGAQWAYGQVRDTMARVIPPVKGDS